MFVSSMGPCHTGTEKPLSQEVVAARLQWGRVAVGTESRRNPSTSGHQDAPHPGRPIRRRSALILSALARLSFALRRLPMMPSALGMSISECVARHRMAAEPPAWRSVEDALAWRPAGLPRGRHGASPSSPSLSLLYIARYRVFRRPASCERMLPADLDEAHRDGGRRGGRLDHIAHRLCRRPACHHKPVREQLDVPVELLKVRGRGL